MADELTPRDAAQELGVTVRTVQRWIADGRLPARRIGSRVRLSRSSLSAVRADPVGATPTPVRTLLIANRGEIAVRVARTARRLGMRIVGVHAADDRSPDGMDEVHRIDSYLDGPGIIDVAVRAGVDAIHPGYGFLAENAGFARAVTSRGLTWVGPPADAIAAMGDKAAARQRAASLGVPTVPGFDGDASGDRDLAAEAERIGYPLLVKPSAGGGGKGMRVAHAPGDLPDAVAGARREAQRSFGDDRLILERYLAGSRHVEIQVLFDARGAGTHLGERDCSTQRRNQKILEEAPAPSVTAELRGRMGESALAVASGVGYVGAGTVEMLLTDAGEHFFLEMNTRLQVEHPVTEAVTGRDLVEDQLRIASGASLAELGLGAPVAIRGHGIEARLYAEDPESGFLPATGRLELVRWPAGVRIDTAVRDGDHITDRYDPMIAKLIAHGPTRAEALERLREALAATAVLGVRTNLRFLRWLVDQPWTRDGEVRTDTLGRVDLPEPPMLEETHWQAAARAVRASGTDAWADGWRLNAPPVVRLRHDAGERSVEITDSAGTVSPTAVAGDGSVHVDVDGQSVELAVASPPTVEEALRHAAATGSEDIARLVAPMPGRVIAVRAAEGAAVDAHQPIVILEAMKMEHAVVTPIRGTLARLHVTDGEQVQRGDVLAEVAQSDP